VLCEYCRQRISLYCSTQWISRYERLSTRARSKVLLSGSDSGALTTYRWLHDKDVRQTWLHDQNVRPAWNTLQIYKCQTGFHSVLCKSRSSIYPAITVHAMEPWSTTRPHWWAEYISRFPLEDHRGCKAKKISNKWYDTVHILTSILYISQWLQDVCTVYTWMGIGQVKETTCQFLLQ
jgi:hypothetical protein